MRLAPVPLGFLLRRGWPPEIGVRGDKRNQLTKWCSEGNDERSADFSEDDLYGAGTDAVDTGEADPGEAP